MAENQMAENTVSEDENIGAGNEFVASDMMPESILNEASFRGNHAVRGPSSYSCSRCGNAYTRLHSLNRHIKFECGVEPQFECPVCHKKSKHKHNLLLHMRTHQKL